MPPLPGWGHRAIGRRRAAARAAITSLLSSPAKSRRAAAAASSARSLLPRVAVWLAIGGLVALFGMATDGLGVAVVAAPAAIVALTWRQLSPPVRVVTVLGLLWLSVAQLGPGLSFGLDALLVAWWWLPTRVGAARDEPAPPAPAEPEATGSAPGSSAHDDPVNLHLPASLRRFAEERHLSQEEVAMLASIRFSGEPPRTAARWHHIYNAIRLSRWLDKEDVG
jgi:hypothetical protein